MGAEDWSWPFTRLLFNLSVCSANIQERPCIGCRARPPRSPRVHLPCEGLAEAARHAPWGVALPWLGPHSISAVLATRVGRVASLLQSPPSAPAAGADPPGSPLGGAHRRPRPAGLPPPGEPQWAGRGPPADPDPAPGAATTQDLGGSRGWRTRLGSVARVMAPALRGLPRRSLWLLLGE